MIILASINKETLLCWKSALSKTAFLSSCNTFSALKKNLQQLNPQLILIDYELPGFIGYQSIQELLAISKQIKIVLFGPNLSDEMEWDFFKAGIVQTKSLLSKLIKLLMLFCKESCGYDAH